MGFPVTSLQVWYFLVGVAAFSLFWAIERSLFFLGKWPSLWGRARIPANAEIERILQEACRDLGKASLLASSSKTKDVRLGLLRQAKGSLSALSEIAKKEKQAVQRFSLFQREAYAIGTSVGLLGTIAAMIENLTAGSNTDLSQSIGHAMRATGLGLIIGLGVTYGCGTLFTKWANSISSDIDWITDHFTTHGPNGSAGRA